jgi:hypothetical protein
MLITVLQVSLLVGASVQQSSCLNDCFGNEDPFVAAPIKDQGTLPSNFTPYTIDLHPVFGDEDDGVDKLTYDVILIEPRGIVHASIENKNLVRLSYLSDGGPVNVTVAAMDPCDNKQIDIFQLRVGM